MVIGAGQMGSGHMVTAMYEITQAGSDEDIPSIDPLKYQESKKTELNKYSNELLTIKVRYKKPDGRTSMLLEQAVTDYSAEIDDASDNLRFAAAVAEFGMILRDSEFKGSATLESAAILASSAKGNDEEGYRSEMIRLINTAKGMRLLSDRE